jgi:hypothetical protein
MQPHCLTLTSYTSPLPRIPRGRPVWSPNCARPTRGVCDRAVRFPRTLTGIAELPFNFAHGTSTVLSCAFCEQEGRDRREVSRSSLPLLHLRLFPSYNDELQANPLAF